MKKVFSIKILFSSLVTLVLLQASSVSYAQTSASSEECAQAQEDFVSIMKTFHSAYFMRQDVRETAETVLADQVRPAAEQIYQVCPEEIAGVIRGGVERANLSLSDPRRWELVACDQALVKYKGLLRRYDSTSLGGYSDYRNLLNHDINPAALAAVDDCPQMTDLERQTRIEITERQRRLDRMEDMDNFGDTIADNIADMNAELEESSDD